MNSIRKMIEDLIGETFASVIQEDTDYQHLEREMAGIISKIKDNLEPEKHELLKDLENCYCHQKNVIAMGFSFVRVLDLYQYTNKTNL